MWDMTDVRERQYWCGIVTEMIQQHVWIIWPMLGRGLVNFLHIVKVLLRGPFTSQVGIVSFYGKRNSSFTHLLTMKVSFTSVFIFWTLSLTKHMKSNGEVRSPCLILCWINLRRRNYNVQKNRTLFNCNCTLVEGVLLRSYLLRWYDIFIDRSCISVVPNIFKLVK